MPKRDSSYVENNDDFIKRTRLLLESEGTDGFPDINGLMKSWISTGEIHRSISQPSRPTRDFYARSGIRRCIAITLNANGYESANAEAFESFTEMAEIYLASIIKEINRLATSSRRENPIPIDFGIIVGQFNLSTSSLKPHLKHSVSRTDTQQVCKNKESSSDSSLPTLPLLSIELSGQVDKSKKRYIPQSFPDFPSTHTYRFTLEDDARVRDPKRVREDAARNAQQGEDALRKLVRASKMRKQKEVKSLVECDNQGKERFRLWEFTMRRFMAGDRYEVEIADHSMLVNGEASFSRKETPRLGKKKNHL